MNTRIFVISDLHLGGDEGFQMCSAKGRALLADFIGWVDTQRSDARAVQLVIAGDIVDFLAERDPDGGFSAFTLDEPRALGKLNRILKRTDEVWTALATLVSHDVRVTLLLGNHDLELSFPALRARLVSKLGGAGVDFLYDNEAFTAGRLLIEHGNRYDGFNQVDHDALRRVRSHLSRHEQPAELFPVQPGSDLVAQVMNRIKEKYPFVDLLKPETSGVVPILAALDGRVWLRLGAAIKQGVKAWYRGGFDGEGIPNRREFIAARTAPAGADPAAETLPDEDAFALADDLARQEAGEQIGWFSDVKVSALLRAFRKRREKDMTTFKVGTEAGTYLEPARRLAKRDFGVVVMGHTHLVKRVAVDGGVYLNTGTWADLMCIPDAVYEGSEPDGHAALQTFLDDIKENRIDRYRRPVPTFARIDVDDGQASGDVFFYDGQGRTEVVSDAGLLRRLGMAG